MCRICVTLMTVALALAARGQEGLNCVVLGSFYTPGLTMGVAVQDSLAYLADGLGGLLIVDVGVSGFPELLGSFSTQHNVEDVALGPPGSHLAYLADGIQSGLRVIDVQDPDSLRQAGFCPIEGECHALAVAGEHAYVANLAGLHVINISDPLNPFEVGVSPGVQAHGVAVSGNRAYVADWTGGMRVVDVSDPASPQTLGVFDLAFGHGVAAQGNLAYVTDFMAALRIVDVGDPAHPQGVGFISSQGAAWGVAVSHDLAYLANGYAGLRVIDVGNPQDPQEVGFCDTPGFAYRVAVVDSTAYVVTDAGMFIIAFERATSLTPVPEAPAGLELLSCAPNPFNPSTTLRYRLERPGVVSLRVFDLSGRLVRELAAGPHGADEHQVKFDGGGLPSGVYLARLESGEGVACRKMLLLK